MAETIQQAVRRHMKPGKLLGKLGRKAARTEIRKMMRESQKRSLYNYQDKSPR